MFGAGGQIVKYGFAAGRVSVLETRMVSGARIRRLIDAENIDEVHRILTETDYGPELRSADTVDEVEAALSEHLSRAYTMLRESRVPADMESFFRSRYDYINLRMLLKSGLGQKMNATYSPLGWLPDESAESFVETDDFSGMPAPLVAAAREAIAKYNTDHRFEDIDIILDRHYFKDILDLAAGLKSKWIVAYTKLLIDLANGRIVSRLSREGVLDDYFIEGGNIGQETWSGLSAGKSIAEGLESFPHGDLRDQLTVLAGRGFPVADYDLVADNIAVELLGAAGRFNVGPEQVFAYVAAREHEVKLLRLIISGHLSGLAPSRIKERVGRIYE